jgi:glutathione synthase/RimK-type ligase-like ATP-grasp enzyme
MFARAGDQVFVAESARVHLGRASRLVTRTYQIPKPRTEPDAFARELERIVQLERIDLVIPTCEEVFWISGMIQSSSLREKFFVANPNILLELHDKSRFARLARTLELRFPETRILQSRSDLERLSRTQKWILKPAFSRFAAKTQVLEVGAKPTNIEPSADQIWLAQQFLEGQELCSFAVARDGRVQAFVLYRPVWRAGLGAGVMFESLAADDPVSLEALRMTSVIVGDTNFSGQIAFDFIQTNDGLHVLECNPRATSGVHLFAPENHLERAYWQHLETPITPAAGRRAMLALPMILYGFPSAIRSGHLGEWWIDLYSTRDVVFDRDDSLPAFQQIWCALELLREAGRLHCSLLEASTADIEWNGEVFPVDSPEPHVELLETADQLKAVMGRSNMFGPSVQVFQAWMRLPSRDLAKNVQTRLMALRVDDSILPVTVNDSEINISEIYNSYVVSPISHYVTYAKEELRELEHPTLERILEILLDSLGVLLRWGEADKIVQVNNSFVSTNLHPRLEFGQVQAIIASLERRFPNHAIAFRSVHAYRGSRLPEFLLEAGFRLVPARSVLFVDTPAGGFKRKIDFKRDLKLLAASGYRIRKLEHPNESELERVCELYGLLYLKKYSMQNPQFTPKFLEIGLKSEWLEVFVLEQDALEHNGRIDGTLAFYQRDDAPTTPIVGYDTQLPLETGLYRMLTVFLLLEAERRGLQVHASSGVAKFKRSRGASGKIEFTAVATRHLPWRRRFVWALLEFLLRRVAMPIISRLGL